MRRCELGIISIVVLVMLAVAMSGCTAGSTDNSGLKSGLADNPNYKIEIIGGKSPTTVTFADIKAMGFVEKKGVVMVNSAGTEKTGDYVGVPLMDVINKAGMPDGEYNFKISASDGYSKVYTREQVEKAILALKENGTALTDNVNKNSIKLVLPGEPGEMWMKVPVKIELTTAASSSSEQVVLNITGVGDKPIGLKMSKLQSYPVKSLSLPYKNNTTLNVSGILLNKLLDDYSNKNATKIKFVASDGYNKTLSLADVRADQDAIIAIDQKNGTLRAVVPTQPYSAWVSKLATIELV
ncbi:Oxidoreductase molybdopterin binding domain-containing protein [Methanocella conradii HZ254]|uniref:Oxidoreductase molybdopterin binding domain-containing protein n=1 Tax=Methanocella conradii (strain DSM 24694 / JCM 17849 / CGMCC 1.5162 / HZ254) TaxID=1041930 RepID=H8I5G1_METCZ|nr:molybdopterin-dependent oxidoreductase [Methanocella conradii]AFC98855.1 Oxidoreductase molybdopterin binding domain-containing protein [Methanocella conradii HZ254]